MHRLLKLYEYELKSALGYMIRAVVCFALAILIIAASVYGYVKYVISSQGNSLVTYGVVLKDSEDNVIPEMIGFANNISSLNGFCRLEIFDETEAFEKLDNGDIRIVMVVPESFLEDAEGMKETQITLYTKGELTQAEYKILALFNGVEGVMQSTEGAILAMYSGMEEYTFSCSRAEMENGIMQMFMTDFLARYDYFDEDNVSAYGKFTVLQHYIASVLLLLVTLSGVVYFKLYNEGECKIETIMSLGKKNKLLSAFAKIMCIAIPITITMWITLIVGKVVAVLIKDYSTDIGIGSFFVALLIGMSIASIIHIIATVVDRQAERVTLYILITVLFSLISGSIGSIYYLPDFLRKISAVWPMSGQRQMIMQSVWGRMSSEVSLRVMIQTVLLMIVGVLLYSRKLAKHD